MKKASYRIAIVFAAVCSFGLMSSVALSQEKLESLRGSAAGNAKTDIAPIEGYRLQDGAPIARNFIDQPPLTPHKSEDYQVTLKVNQCLDCHSWENYQKEKATKISLTHFKDRDGNQLDHVASNRYFCTQCHVSQTDAKALVGNTFTGLGSRR